jgi:hypothetical protein
MEIWIVNEDNDEHPSKQPLGSDVTEVEMSNDAKDDHFL